MLGANWLSTQLKYNIIIKEYPLEMKRSVSWEWKKIFMSFCEYTELFLLDPAICGMCLPLGPWKAASLLEQGMMGALGPSGRTRRAERR